MDNFKFEVAVTVDFSESVKSFLSGLFGISNKISVADKTAEIPEAEAEKTMTKEEKTEDNTNASQYWSKDDVICTLRTIGKDKAKAVLEHFGVTKVSELTADKYGEVIEYAKE